MKAKLFAGALALGLWGGAALAEETQVTATTTAPSDQVKVKVSDQNQEMVQARRNEYMRGVMVTASGGFEDFTGSLDGIAAGPTWGVTLGIKPTRVLGLELGYTGAVHELKNSFYNVRGPDIVRNGAQVAATVGLTTTPVQPYLLAGVGVNRFNTRSTAFGRSDTSGQVPLGGGVRAHIKHFTADARFNYNLMFGNDLAGPGAAILGYRANNAAEYQGTLAVGSTF